MSTSSISDKLVKRRPNRYISHGKRHILGLSSNQQHENKRLTKLLHICLILKGTKGKRQSEYENLYKIVLVKYLRAHFMTEKEVETRMEQEANPDRHLTIDSFSDGDCKVFFRFLKSDLKELFEELNFDKCVVFVNRKTLSGEEVFLRGLYELVSGSSQYEIRRNVFGGTQGLQSFAFNYFINFMYGRYAHLVHDNLQWWYDNGFMEESRAAIEAKMGMPLGSNEYALFIDCKCTSCQVTGGGPAEAGAGAPRWDTTLQQAFYNGWKSIHGLKHQTVDTAHGFTVDMFGPTSLRRNDLDLLSESNINDRLAALQAHVDYLYHMKIFGDSAYRIRSHCRSYHQLQHLRPLLTDEEYDDLKEHNYRMKTVRISIEWNYGVTAKLFRYMQNMDKLKLLQSDAVAKVYTVATIFRNFHVAKYGGISSNYFGLNAAVRPDFLHHYINQINFN